MALCKGARIPDGFAPNDIEELVMVRLYLEIHRPQFQMLVDGIPVDPIMPLDFDSISHDDRDPLEIEDWFGRPYIRTSTWSDREECYRAVRAEGLPPEADEHWCEEWWPAEGSDECFEAELFEQKVRWYASFPEGVRYEIRCMGGAYGRDRSATCTWGYCASLADAIAVANSGDNRYKDADINRRLVQHREHREGFE